MHGDVPHWGDMCVAKMKLIFRYLHSQGIADNTGPTTDAHFCT